ncbi:MAG TPA: zinc ribbon domain-containing protein [Usitatibacteraceae bacterium]|nr:zinc ribbon domain-containing protein [Usitatibacteraceae bacterium]
MPIYEYQCSDCKKDFEKLVRASDPALACPHCGGTHLSKKLSTFAAVTSGGGSSMADLPAACQTCGNPGGPGSCGMGPH